MNMASNCLSNVLTLVFYLLFAVASGAATAPAGKWTFDEGQGNQAGDASGNNNHGAIHGAKWAEGVRGKALEFDGSSYVEISDHPSLQFGDMTLSVWMKLSGAAASYMRVLSKKKNWRDSEGYSLAVNSLVWQMQFLGNPSGPTTDIASSTGVSEFIGDGWVHVAVTAKGNAVRFYANGRDVTADGTTALIQKGNQPLLLGCEQNTTNYSSGKTDFFNGWLDELHLFNAALSEKEVRELYSAMVPILKPVTDFGGGGSRPRLSWSTVPGAETYKVEVAVNTYFITTTLGRDVGAATELVPDVDLKPGTYYWRVKIKEGLYSSTGHFVVGGAASIQLNPRSFGKNRTIFGEQERRKVNGAWSGSGFGAASACGSIPVYGIPNKDGFNP